MTAINKSATKLLSTTRDTAEAHVLRSKLDNLNKRYEHLSGPAQASCEFLQRLSDRLGRLQEEVDGLEDWLVPMLDVLKADDLASKDLTELETILQVELGSGVGMSQVIENRLLARSLYLEIILCVMKGINSINASHF